MATSDKLPRFLSYVANYLYVYRIKFNKTPNDNVQLKFLANSTPDTLIINCCSSEPVVSVNDYWYNGAILRKCISENSQEQYGFRKTYKTCYVYEDAFSSTLISLNPEISLEGVVTTTSSPYQGTSSDYVSRNGDTMNGPLFLARNPIEDNEAVNKNYVSNELFKVNSIISRNNVQISIVESNIANLFSAIEVLDPNSTKLNLLIERIESAETSNAVFIEADRRHTSDINNLVSRLTELESGSIDIATKEKLGGVKIGSGLTVDSDGTISVDVVKCKSTTVSNAQTKLLFGTKNFLQIENNTAVAFVVKVIGRNTTITNEGCAFIIQGMVLNNGNISFVGSVVKTTIAKSNALWNADVTIDTANKGLVISVTGTNGSTIRWSAIVDITVAD